MNDDDQSLQPRLPAKPLLFLSSDLIMNSGSSSGTSTTTIDVKLVDVSEVEAQLLSSHDVRDAAFTAARELQAVLGHARGALDTRHVDEATRMELDARLDTVVYEIMTKYDDTSDSDGDFHSNAPRVANLGHKMETYIRYKAYQHFIATGTLVSMAHLSSINTKTDTNTNNDNTTDDDDDDHNKPSTTKLRVRDEEYLAGAGIGLSHDLARYAVGRAIARDVSSVRLARNLAAALMANLLQFDFRNGYLRRKYDGVKYALKKIENILYELSVTSCDDDDDGGNDPERRHKKPKLDTTTTPTIPNIVHEHEFGQIRTRMEQRDELRESLIKRCRDAQKTAKQAIFALHREADHGTTTTTQSHRQDSATLLQDCERMIKCDLYPIVVREPGLRTGSSFSGVLEEYVEAKLFQRWLLDGRTVWTLRQLHDHLNNNSDEDDTTTTTTTTTFKLLPVEYLGGLCDLTGEIGRYAVKMGTVRDREAVRRCLATNTSVLCALQNGCDTYYLPNSTQKKLGALRMSVEKLEHMSYELSLLEAGRSRNSSGSGGSGSEMNSSTQGGNPEDMATAQQDF